MKFAAGRPYANPEAAARKLVEIANSVEAVQDGRIYIELINYPTISAQGAYLRPGPAAGPAPEDVGRARAVFSKQSDDPALFFLGRVRA